MVATSAIWTTRNKATFDKHRMRTPCEIIFFASHFLEDQGKEKLNLGATKMLEVVMGLLRAQSTTCGGSYPLFLKMGE
jgi:hypothetical protein